MSPARKPVIVRKLSREWLSGYAISTPAEGDQEFEILDTAGKLTRIELAAVKWVCYVRELGADWGGLDIGPSALGPERLLRKRFSSRPRMPGLWLRLGLVDGDEIEGVAPNDRSLAIGPGLLMMPPDTRSNTQRIFVPRTAIEEVTILSVIAGPVEKSAFEKRVVQQPQLFGMETVDPEPDHDVAAPR